MKAVIYTQNNCQFTPQEKTYLTSKGVTFEERNVEVNKTFLDEMMKLGANFAGTPVTQITKDDGTTTVLKGFTQTEFDAALGGASVAMANADMNVPTTPTPATPAEPVQSPPASVPDLTPVPEPTPLPVEPVTTEPVVQTANADITMPKAPTDQPVVPPVAEPSPAPTPEPTPMPTPAPVEPPAPTSMPVEPAVQEANADITMPQAPTDQPVVAPVPEPAPAPMPTPAPVEPPVQTASNPLDAILADLQQKVSAASPAVQSPSDTSVQAANADMTMPTTPTTPPAPDPVAPATSDAIPPTPPTPSIPNMPTPPVPTDSTGSPRAADLPSVPDFNAK